MNDYDRCEPTRTRYGVMAAATAIAVLAFIAVAVML